MKALQKGELALLLVVFQSAIVTIALEVGSSDIGVMAFLFYTNLVGALTMLFIMYAQDRCREFISLFRNLGRLLSLCAMAFTIAVVAELLLVIGTLQTTPSISGILYRLYPIFIALLTPLMMHQKISMKQYASLGLAFASVYVVLSNGTLISLDTMELPAILMLVGSAVTTAVPTLMVRKYNISGSVFMALSTIVASVVFFPAMLILQANPLPIMSIPTVLSILFIGIIEFGVGGVLYYYSYKILNPSLVGAAILTTPFLTVLVAYLTLGTPMQTYYFFAAGLLVLAAIVQKKELISAPERIKLADAGKMQIFDVTSAFIDNKSAIISRHISGENRALAIKLDVQNAKKFMQREILLGESLFFIHTQPHEDIRTEEIDFLKEILGLQPEHIALIGMGEPETIEKAFGETLVE